MGLMSPPHDAAGPTTLRTPRAAALLASPLFFYSLLGGLIALSAAGTLLPAPGGAVWDDGRFPVRALLLRLLRPDDFYHSGLFAGLLAGLAASLAACTWTRRARRPDVLLTHAAVMAVLAGGLLSAAGGRSGTMAPAPGETLESVDATRPFRLPFAVRLEGVRIDRERATAQRPLGGALSRLASDVSIVEDGRVAARGQVAVNEPLRWRGWTLHQGGDATAPRLLVSRDPGVPLVYAGLLGLTLSLGWTWGRGAGRRA